jgi:hypothetical protein
MMTYDNDWIPPWREGLPQARCQGPNCTQAGVGTLVVEITLTDGFCAQCARTVDDSRRELR